MKKSIILFLAIFMLTGCDLSYNLEINEKKFNETITITEKDSTKWNNQIIENNNETYKEKIDWIINNPVYVEKNADVAPYEDTPMLNGIKYYQQEKINNQNGYGVKLNTNGNIKEINNLRSLSYCYEFASIINNNEEYIISTSFKNYCFEQYLLLDKININITTDMKVNSNNADRVSGNTYTWIITRENYSNKSISLAMQSISEYEEEKKEELQNNVVDKEKNNKKDYTLYIFCGILITLILIGYLIFKKIKDKSENFGIDD